MIEIKIKKLSETATIPTNGSEYAAGYDLYANCPDANYGIFVKEEGVCIPPHQTVKIGTGLSIQPPPGYFGAIFARSGLATKQGLRPANCVGVCDEDYRGEYIVPVHNDTDDAKIIHHGDRIAQLVFLPYVTAKFIEVNELSETNRGDNGFGSSGV